MTNFKMRTEQEIMMELALVAVKEHDGFIVDGSQYAGSFCLAGIIRVPAQIVSPSLFLNYIQITRIICIKRPVFVVPMRRG